VPFENPKYLDRVGPLSFSDGEAHSGQKHSAMQCTIGTEKASRCHHSRKALSNKE
jgi:hypothetical protein